MPSPLSPNTVPGLALNVIANDAPKAITYMDLLEVGEVTRNGLQNHMENYIGIDPARTSHAIGAYAVTFAKFGFAESYMDQSKFSTRQVRYFRALHDTEATPSIGTMLDWSLQFDRPLRTFLAQTPSTSHVSRGPSNSITLLSNILRGIKLSDITDHDYAVKPINSKLQQLISEGIVTSEPARFKIDNPSYNGRRPFENLKPSTQHTYKTLQIAKQVAADKEWSIEELHTLACSLLPIEHQGDAKFIKSIRRSIADAASDAIPKAFGKAIKKTYITSKAYSIVETHRDAVADLIERTDKLAAAEPSFLKEATDQAYDIYSNTFTARSFFVDNE